MFTLYDYLPSQNGYKIRLLLNHLQLAFVTKIVSIFEGGGQTEDYLAINPTGAVPALGLDDGRTLAESNAILMFLAEGTRYYAEDTFERAKIHQWLSFEADYVQSSIGTLRHWTLTDKLPRRPAQLVQSKREGSLKALRILNNELSRRAFIAGDIYSIADMSLFAYAHLAPDAGIALEAFPHFNAWVERVRQQPGFLPLMYPYSIDPHSTNELP